jgi:adenylate cyclase
MANKAEQLWGYLTGAVDSPLAATGTSISTAMDRFRGLLGRDDVDFEAEGLLEGAEDPDARRDLLRQLHAAGVPLDDLKQAVREDRLALLPVEAVLQASGEHTLEEMAGSSGLAEEVLARRMHALGISRPDSDTVFHDDAMSAARALKELEDSGMPEEAIDDICRILGRSIQRTAEGVRQIAGDAYIQAGDNERDLGLRYAAATRRMIPVFAPLLEFTMTMQLLKLVRSDVITRAELATGSLPDGHDITVCFADLTDFTRLSEQLPAEQIGDLVRRFEDLVEQKTPPEAQYVKTIGDAAMIVSPEPDAVLEAALELVRAADDLHGKQLPPIHAGVAMGRAVSREGDWHGRPVNLASRLAESAPPGRIYATADVCRASANGFEWTDGGDQQLKGIDDAVQVFCLSPANGD